MMVRLHFMSDRPDSMVSAYFVPELLSGIDGSPATDRMIHRLMFLLGWAVRT